MQHFAQLWLENQNAVAVFIYLKIRDYHAAEDVLQEVARSAAGSFDRYDPARPFAGWAIAIAKQRVADYYRKAHRHKPTLSLDAMNELELIQEELGGELDDQLCALRLCIDALSDRHREMIKMRYGRALTPKQIADEVGLKHTAVNVLIYRVRKALAECISRRLKMD